MITYIVNADVELEAASPEEAEDMVTECLEGFYSIIREVRELDGTR